MTDFIDEYGFAYRLEDEAPRPTATKARRDMPDGPIGWAVVAIVVGSALVVWYVTRGGGAKP